MNLDCFTDKILPTLYGAPTQPELWNAFLEELSIMSGVNKAALISHHLDEKDHRILAILSDSMKESVRLYEDCYCQFDEWTLRFPKCGAGGRIVQGEEIWPEDSLLKSTYYNEFLKKVDVRKMACIAPIAAPGTFESFSIYRGRSEHDFDPEQLAILRMLVPHLRLALVTRRRLQSLESRIADLENSLDQLKTALVLIDRKGKSVLVNRAAQRIFDQRDGLYLGGSGLVALSNAETVQLRGIITKALGASTGKPLMHGGAVLISRANKRPLQVLAAPFISRSVEIPHRAAAIIFITDPDLGCALSPDMLRELYSLTQAEVRLALLLLKGSSLTEAAELNGVRMETVRSQIKSILQKTGTRRQGELIGLLTSLPSQIR